MKGYILVKLRPGTHFQAKGRMEDAMQRFPEIKSCDVIYGELDLVVTIDAQSEEKFLAAHSNVALDPDVVETRTHVVTPEDAMKKAWEEFKKRGSSVKC